MNVGDLVEAHNSRYGYRGEVVDMDADYVTLTGVARWDEDSDSWIHLKSFAPVTLYRDGFEWVAARFQAADFEGRGL